MLKKDLKDLHTNLIALSNMGGAKLAYIIGKNLKIISDELALIEKSISITDEYKEFQQERLILCTKHSHKNEDGSPRMNNRTFDIIDYDAFTVEYKVLKDKYQTSIDSHESIMEDYENLLNEESDIEVNLTKIKIDLIPETYIKLHGDGTFNHMPIGPLVTPLISLIED